MRIEEAEDDDNEPEEEQRDAVTGDDGYNSDTDPVDDISHAHAVTTPLEKVAEPNSQAMEDVLTSFSHLHLPGFQEVENLALLLLLVMGGQHDGRLPPLAARHYSHYCAVVHLFTWLINSLSLSSPNLSGRRLDVYHTLAHGVGYEALVRI